MTHIISAFPCLGKTTLFTLNKDTIFDREFNESRSIRGMSQEEQKSFFQHCADMVQLQKDTGYYDYIFITDNPELVTRLDPTYITHIYPDIFNESVMADYKQSVIERSGLDWYERVIPPKISNLKEHIQELLNLGCDVRLTNLDQKHIEDVFEFNSRTILPHAKAEKKELKIMNSTNFMLFAKDRLDQFVVNEGHHFTEDIKEAMFLWPDGSMTSSSELGIRGDDHNILNGYFECLGKNEIFELSQEEMFEVAAATVGTVLLTPETETASIAENQKMTKAQEDILVNSSYKIDNFSEGITQNQGLKKLNMEELNMNNTNFPLYDEEELQQFVEETGISFTEYAEEAMFLWPDGKMTSSNDEFGVRAADHNILRSYFEYLDRDEIFSMPRKDMLEVAAATVGIVIMVPESQKALIAKNQTMTKDQEAILVESFMDVDYHAEGISQDQALEKLDLDLNQVEELKEKNQDLSINI